MRALMLQLAAIVPGHVHFPRVYILLTFTEYPSPGFAFRFLVGAPLVGQFSSSAFLPQHIGHGSLSEGRIRQIEKECKLREKFVVVRLDRDTAIKSHLKFRKEFPKRYYRVINWGMRLGIPLFETSAKRMACPILPSRTKV